MYSPVQPSSHETMQPVTLAVPPGGETVTVPMTPNLVVDVLFSLASANIALTGPDLRLEFAEAAVMILSDFTTMIERGVSPLLLLADGSVVAGDVLLTALNAELPATEEAVTPAPLRQPAARRNQRSARHPL